MDDEIDLSQFLDFAKYVAVQSAKLITAQQRPSRISAKGENDFVTDLDYASQEVMVNLLRQKYPTHGYLAEESENVAPPAKYTWVIDPIDGTVNYIRQRSPYCVSLGLLIDGAPRVGVIYELTTCEMFSAAVGRGFYVNDKRVENCAPIADLKKAAVALDWDTSTVLRVSGANCVQHLIPHVQTMPVIGCASLALAWIASGRIDAYFKFDTHPWDIVAGAVMIHETHGRISRHNNDDWYWNSADKTLLASNGCIHEALLPYL